MPGDYLVGIDNGGTFAKAVVFDRDGRELGVGSGSIALIESHPGWSDVDFDTLWTQTAAAVREAIARSGVDPAHIAGVGLSGTGNGLCIVGEGGRPLRPMVLSSDARAAGIVEAWNSRGLGERLFPIIRQGLWTGQPASLLAWLRQQDPAMFGAIRHVMLCKDWIRLQLTGEILTDTTDATAAGLTDVASETYSEEALDARGLADVLPLLPPIARRATVAGRITAAAAALTGLAEGTPVATGLFDCAAMALGAGCVTAGQVCLSIGTWSINEVVVEEPKLAAGIAFTTSHAVPGQWLLLDGSATSATNLTWYLEELAAADYAEAAKRGVSVYHVLDEALRSVPPGSEGVLFHPYVHGSLTNPSARAAFLGIGAWHHRAHLQRAVYEGVAFSHLDHVNNLRAVVPIDEARLTGGGANSAEWCQMFADVLDMPVVVPPWSEIGARGAALDAGVAVGVYGSHAAAAAEASSSESGAARRYEPDAGVRDAYAHAHEASKTASRALGNE
jgi:L-xylulokinase